MPNLYNTTAMLISGNLKERKNGDGCFLLQLSDIDSQYIESMVYLNPKTDNWTDTRHTFFKSSGFFSVFSHLQRWDLKWYEKLVENLPTSVAPAFQYHGTTFF